jgi:hypothetical protein
MAPKTCNSHDDKRSHEIHANESVLEPPIVTAPMTSVRCQSLPIAVRDTAREPVSVSDQDQQHIPHPAVKTRIALASGPTWTSASSVRNSGKTAAQPNVRNRELIRRFQGSCFHAFCRNGTFANSGGEIEPAEENGNARESDQNHRPVVQCPHFHDLAARSHKPDDARQSPCSHDLRNASAGDRRPGFTQHET